MRNTKKMVFLLAAMLAVGCTSENQSEDDHHDHNHDTEEGAVVYFSQQQFDAFSLRVDTISWRNINSYVEVNGMLEVPPQNEASVTTVIGANIASINVIEGDKVAKGEVLAMISHPDLIQLQTDYVMAWSQLQFLEKEYHRQQKLYQKQVGSGKAFQKITAEYLSYKGKVNGYQAQLNLVGLNIDKLKQGEIAERVPLRSPIDGHVQLVQIKTGQYALPQKELFQIVNIHHIHADLMVFENDIHKVKEGQKVKFSVASEHQGEMEAVIYAVGKAFEEEPKAIHLHAEIENKEGLLLPGMYVKGRILIDDKRVEAVPEEAVVREGDKHFIFIAEEKENKGGMKVWKFTPLEVGVGQRDGEWLELVLFSPLAANTRIAVKGAYYLISELKKEEAEHSH